MEIYLNRQSLRINGATLTKIYDAFMTNLRQIFDIMIY